MKNKPKLYSVDGEIINSDPVEDLAADEDFIRTVNRNIFYATAYTQLKKNLEETLTSGDEIEAQICNSYLHVMSLIEDQLEADGLLGRDQEEIGASNDLY